MRGGGTFKMWGQVGVDWIIGHYPQEGTMLSPGRSTSPGTRLVLVSMGCYK